ncbi:MAG: helix-turn-helix domain-containing protein [Clostridiales bacterium]|nr:helix-turn-helix domain-containing protein [Clostridiales bacterium]
MTFGGFIKEKRTEKGINLRKLAELVNIAPAYLSDIEKGKRNSPSAEKMDRIAEVLGLSKDEIEVMRDLAANDRPNNVAPDISEYVTSNESVRVALRKARALNLSNQDWIKIIEEMEKAGNKK